MAYVHSELSECVVLTRERVTPSAILGCLSFPTGSPDALGDIKTLELPYLNNKPFVSSIPAGYYEFVPRIPSAKFRYPHMEVCNVPDRTGILMHIGNYPLDTTGCILVGEDFFADDVGVSNSRVALKKVMAHVGEMIARTGQTSLTLLIQDIEGGLNYDRNN